MCADWVSFHQHRRRGAHKIWVKRVKILWKLLVTDERASVRMSENFHSCLFIHCVFHKQTKNISRTKPPGDMLINIRCWKSFTRNERCFKTEKFTIFSHHASSELQSSVWHIKTNASKRRELTPFIHTLDAHHPICEAKLSFIDNGPQISEQQTRRTNKRAHTWKSQPENSPFSDEV